MPTVSTSAITNITQIYILLPFRSLLKRSKYVLTQRTLKNALIKKIQILYTRINSILGVLSIIPILSEIEILTLIRTSLASQANTQPTFRISTIILRETIRKKRYLQTLLSCIQIRNLLDKRTFLIQSSVQYIIL